MGAGSAGLDTPPTSSRQRTGGHAARSAKPPGTARPDQSFPSITPTQAKRQRVKLGPNRARRGFASSTAGAANSQNPLIRKGF